MIDLQTLPQRLARYRQPDRFRAIFELATTLLPLAGLWTLMWLSLGVGYWLTLLLAVPAAGLVVRLFMIQHDCGHGTFFGHRLANDWVGRVLGIFTLTPYDYWKRNHAIHHATSGNLDRRGIGDIDTLTVAEYQAKSRIGRLAYRCYRNVFVMFGIGPAWLFLLQHRLPFFQMRAGWRPWVSTMVTNAGIVLFAGSMIWLVGLRPFLAIHLPVTLAAASIGVWLFYVQHQFENVEWQRSTDWTHSGAALAGSSYYDLPAVLGWFTANIGIHHVHHLNSRIPFYRLRQVLRDHPELKTVHRLTLRESLRGIRLSLWCENRRKLVAFKDRVR
jgi:omega-6 fatty acid desaturase (delta-12 desaturase)